MKEREQKEGGGRNFSMKSIQEIMGVGGLPKCQPVCEQAGRYTEAAGS